MTELADFLSAHPAAIRVEVTRAMGSTPREAGAWMLVAEGAIWGTIGGGRLELVAMEAARQMLATGREAERMQLPLGPEIGQCCGGRVELTLHRADAGAVLAEAEATSRPHLLIFGAGHVGRALADQAQFLPLRTVLIDSRADQLALSAARVEHRLTPLPEAEIDSAPPGSGFVVMTHDHGQDFLLTEAALRRGDAGYVGMIGSASKRARFAKGAGVDTGALHCPMGGGTGDKRPAVIAAMIAAEVMGVLASTLAVLPMTQEASR